MRLFSKSGLKKLGGLLCVYLALKYGVGAIGVVNSLALVYFGIGAYAGARYCWDNRSHFRKHPATAAGYIGSFCLLVLAWLPLGAYFAADYIGGWDEVDLDD